MTPKNSPLTISEENEELVIRIGIETLAFCFEIGEDNQPWDDDVGNYRRQYKVINQKRFAKGVGNALCDESEDGSTPLTRILDDAFIRAVENDMGVEEDGRLLTNEILNKASWE